MTSELLICRNELIKYKAAFDAIKIALRLSEKLFTFTPDKIATLIVTKMNVVEVRCPGYDKWKGKCKNKKAWNDCSWNCFLKASLCKRCHTQMHKAIMGKINNITNKVKKIVQERGYL